MKSPEPDPGMRIGELARRVGLSAEVLRAWERRYALLRPERSEHGYRLYSATDEQRVHAMLSHMEGGLAPAQAAQAVERGVTLAPEVRSVDLSSTVPDLSQQLARALDSFDEATAHQVLDQLLARLSLDAVLDEVLLPYLRDLGERWSTGEISVAQEHFASAIVRGRLLALARGWGTGRGPLAVLACLPGERHDLGLVAFGLVLSARGWRIRFLGADTPLSAIGDSLSDDPALVLLTALVPARLAAVKSEVAALARQAPVILTGAGVTKATAEAVGAGWRRGGPVQVARELATA